ncbi:dihydroxyacetone kinase 2 [Trichomonascus vanleenenianus]|uniref:dihydroxyacetone kinase n=1 Tax=Trichomonascus vanleenenianus TaxID=2268995 RepID=UPI003ECB4AEE
MSSKQFKSDGDIVLPALRGLVRSCPWLELIESDKVVYRANAASGTAENKKQVQLISLGGAGHEGLNGGYVGDGMLSAAVSGTLFSSPSAKQISEGLKKIRSPKGTLVILMNYTGDVIHSGLAAEKAMAQGDKIEVVVVGDDVAVGRKQGGLVGRRGLAGTVLVHKIAGAAAARGLELSDVASIARSVGNNAVTIGASLDHCNVPGRPFESNLKADEYEIGMGIHNEAGVKKKSPLPSIPQIVSEMLPLLLDESDEDRSFVKFAKSDEVVLMVNNLGGISNLEMSYATEVVHEQLKEKYGILPSRTLTGAFITALNGPGFSITLLNATKAGKDTIALLDAPAKTPAWNQAAVTADWAATAGGVVPTSEGSKHTRIEMSSGVKANATLWGAMLTAGIDSVLKEEPRITKYDTVAGDGDCGETLTNGGNAIIKALKAGELRLDDGVNGITDIADVVEGSMDGTSGGLYSIFLSALAKGVREANESTLDTKCITKALQTALDSLYKYTKARKGDRTLIDALAPFVDTLSSTGDFEAAVLAAIGGADSTRKLEAKFGRATYVNKEEIKQFDKEGGLPDPGAIGLSALLSGMLTAYKK